MKRILIAEDENAIRRMVRALLTRAGFDVTEVQNGVEAIEMIRRETFDLVIVDLMMPLVNGYRVIEVLRSEFPTTSLLVLTAVGEVGLGMLPAGLNVVRKPFDPAQLVRTVTELTGSEIVPH